MNKVVKWVVAFLMFVGIVATVYVYADKGSDTSVSYLLYWTYTMVGIALTSIVCSLVSSAIANPKFLIRLGCVVLGTVALVAGSWFLAPGSDAVGLTQGQAQPTPIMLKLTDTVLILTIIAVCASFAAVLFNFVMGVVRKVK